MAALSLWLYKVMLRAADRVSKSRPSLLTSLLDALLDYSGANVFNPWAARDPLDLRAGSAAARRRRLGQHLDCAAKFVLIGEAAGYQGCHFSGIAFTSERLILEGAIPRVGAPTRITRRPRPWSEPSATIVWGTLHELGIADRVVLWNAFPWHPHRAAEPYSNRRPTGPETRAGASLLRGVLEHFDGATVVGVGVVAGAALRAVGFDAPGVRHPSMAGAVAFRTALAALVRRSSARGRAR
jgi:uracil-DNA glycosylase